MSFLSNIIIFVYVYIPALDIWSSEQTKDKITKNRGVHRGKNGNRIMESGQKLNKLACFFISYLHPPNEQWRFY